eukprot:gene997-biopygen1011
MWMASCTDLIKLSFVFWSTGSMLWMSTFEITNPLLKCKASCGHLPRLISFPSAVASVVGSATGPESAVTSILSILVTFSFFPSAVTMTSPTDRGRPPEIHASFDPKTAYRMIDDEFLWKLSNVTPAQQPLILLAIALQLSPTKSGTLNTFRTAVLSFGSTAKRQLYDSCSSNLAWSAVSTLMLSVMKSGPKNSERHLIRPAT